MNDILGNYYQLDIASMQKLSAWLSRRFGIHDEENDKPVILFLLNSLESGLEKRIKNKTKDQDYPTPDTFVDIPFVFLDN